MADQQQDGDKVSGDVEKVPSVASGSDSAPRPKAYILHRTNGKSRQYPIQEGQKPEEGSDENSDDDKPPCFLCYVPAPVYHLSGVLEQNSFCESFGRIGCFGQNDREKRRKLLLLGVMANVLSFLLSAYACLSISLNFDHIVAGGFSKGLAYIPRLDLPISSIWIGLRGVAIRNFKGGELLNADFVEGDSVLEFDSFCDQINEGLGSFMDTDDCDSCAESSAGLVTSIVMATLLTLPNIFTDILRMYPNYDLNCQKFFGSVLNLVSAASSLYAYSGYATLCFRSFYDGEEPIVVPLLANSTAIQIFEASMQQDDPDFSVGDDPTIGEKIEWQAGNGLICIVLATVLKAIDIAIMLMIPSPDIAHTKSLQEEYEVLYGQDDDQDDNDEKDENENNNESKETDDPKKNEN